MPQETTPPNAQADWFAPAAQRPGVQQYVETLLGKWRWILLAVVLAMVAAGIHLARTPKTYKATADVLVTPIPRGSTSFVGLGLPMESDDPTLDAETASRLITTQAVASRVKSRLGLAMSTDALLNNVVANPVAQASLVAITATSDSPKRAALIANAFAKATTAERTARLDAQLDTLIPQLRTGLKNVPITERAIDPLTTRLRDLEALRLTGDPTLQLETPAVAPTVASGPRTTLTLAAAFLGGLILAICVIIGLQVFDTRLRSEEELRRFRIPILARIPIQRTAFSSESYSPHGMPIGIRDSYRLLATSLRTMQAGGNGGRILVTGSTPSDGKSTTALCLASALASLTEDVVLLELDTRAPSLRRMLDVSPQFDLADVLRGRVSLATALITLWKVGTTGRLRTLVAKRPADPSTSPAPGAMTDLMGQAAVLGGWVVVDAPALNYVADALPVAKSVDSVIVVVRIGNTKVKELDALAELFVQHGIVPAGFVLVGAKSTPYYGEAQNYEFTTPVAAAPVPSPEPAVLPTVTQAASPSPDSKPEPPGSKPRTPRTRKRS
jgi:receptor protein-tyrosine kinase